MNSPEEVIKRLTECTLGGLVDSLLEYGYLGLLTKYAKAGTPLYKRAVNDEHALMTVVEGQDSVLIFDMFEPTREGISYQIHVAINLMLHVSGVTVTCDSALTTSQVVADFHNKITKWASVYDTFGNPRS